MGAIVNQTYTLDVGSTPVRVKVIKVDEKYVYVEYWEGRIEKWTLADWDQFA